MRQDRKERDRDLRDAVLAAVMVGEFDTANRLARRRKCLCVICGEKMSRKSLPQSVFLGVCTKHDFVYQPKEGSVEFARLRTRRQYEYWLIYAYKRTRL